MRNVIPRTQTCFSTPQAKDPSIFAIFDNLQASRRQVRLSSRQEWERRRTSSQRSSTESALENSSSYVSMLLQQGITLDARYGTSVVQPRRLFNRTMPATTLKRTFVSFMKTIASTTNSSLTYHQTTSTL